MCAIAGLVASGRESALARAIGAMVAVQFHRGPDDGGVVLLKAGAADLHAALGNRRLAILDLTPAGHQPMTNADGTVWITFNGEIYNFAALRAELKGAGFEFRSGTDTEVILHGYEAWGIEGTLGRLRGMFAFAIWDSRLRRMYVARDRLGEKPVYYAHLRGSFVFGSELRAILASGLVRPAIDPAALYAYLALGSVPAPLAIAAQVRTLDPGCYLEFDRGVLCWHRYWQPHPAAGVAALGEGEMLERLGELLAESVRIRMVSDVPLGVFLSGGIDSAAVLALMGRAGAARIRAHTMVFPHDRIDGIDEAADARITARRFGAELCEHEVTAAELVDELPRIAAALDQPTVDGVNTYFVAKYARAAGTVVALSGLGGDELFGGYASFRRVPLLMRAGAALRWFAPAGRIARLLAGAAAPARAAGLSDFLAREPTAASAWLAVRGFFCEGEIDLLLGRDLLAEARRRFEPASWLERIPGLDGAAVGTAVSLLELRAYMHNQLLRDTDVMSMAHGLEVRCPLIDHELLEFALAIPAALKFRDRPKAVMVRALGGGIPHAIADRRKRGFSFPFDRWMRGECREQLAGILGGARLVRRESAMKLWGGFLRGRVHWSRVWALAALELWHAEFRHRCEEIGALPCADDPIEVGAAP